MAPSLHASLVPDSVLVAGSWTPTGAGTIVTALGDANNATYASYSGSPSLLFVGLANPSALPSYAQIVSVGFHVVASRPSGTATHVRLALANAAGQLNFDLPTVATGATAYDSPQWALQPDGTPWTIAAINETYFFVIDYPDATGPVRIHEVYATVYINNAPVVSAITPSGTVTTTTKPLIGWTVTDANGDVVERVRVRVFSGSGAVTDPETETARLLYDSGVLYQITTTHKLTQDLANASYVVAVKAADAGSNGSYGAWAQQSFTMSVTIPPDPTFSVVTNQTAQQHEILLTAGAGVSTDYFRVERTVTATGALAWRPVFRAELVASGQLTADESEFDTGVGGWLGNTGVAATYPQRSTAQFYVTPASLQVRANGSGGAMSVLQARRIPVSELVGYDISLRFRATAATAATIEVLALFFGPDGSVFGSGATIGLGSMTPVAESSSSWTLASGTFEAPPGAAYMELIVAWNGVAASSDHFIDQVKVAPRVYDREGPRHASAAIPSTLQYRVKALRYLTPPEMAGTLWFGMVSPATAIVADGQTYLKNAYAGSAGVLAIHQNAGPESTSSEDLAALAAAGRSGWAVFGGTIRGEVGEIAMQFAGDVAWGAFEAIRNAQVPVLLQTCIGDTLLEERWVRLGPDRKRIATTKQGGVQYRRASVGSYEVAVPTL